MSRNEVERDYPYNRALFQRVAQGWCQFNPRLSVRRTIDRAQTWLPVYQAAGVSSYVSRAYALSHLAVHRCLSLRVESPRVDDACRASHGARPLTSVASGS